MVKEENQIKYISTTSELDLLCDIIKKNCKYVGIDTEFIRKKEYFPKLALVQISYKINDVLNIALIDPLSKDVNLNEFKKILISRDIGKIAHSAGQDLEAFYETLDGSFPVGFEDTQIMASFCGMKSLLSLDNITNLVLNTEITKDKEIQVSNWIKRPLTSKQLSYAADDVRYLIDIYEELYIKLQENGNYDFYRQEIEYQFECDIINKHIENAWRHIKCLYSVKDLYYYRVLKIVSGIRESLAIEKNEPRGKTISDEMLFEIIEKAFLKKEDFHNHFNGSKSARSITAKARKIIRNAIKDNYHLRGKSYNVHLKSANEKNILSKINEYIFEVCNKRNIDYSIVTNKMNLASAMHKYETLQSILPAWRYSLLHDGIFNILKSYDSTSSK